MTPKLEECWGAYAAGSAPAPLGWRAVATPLAWLYRLTVCLRGMLYRHGIKRALPLPGVVLSIGNLVAGGTGKSPVTAALAALIAAAGGRPAILARGYGSGLARGDSLALLGGRLLMASEKPARWPDEARMQSEMLAGVPVVCGRDRAGAAARFLREHPEHAPTHWLLDDGLQHLQLRRDAELVLLDAARPFGAETGKGRLLPRGLLREPVAALARADVVIFTRCTERAPTPAASALVRRHFCGPVLAARLETSPPSVSTGGVPFAAAAHTPVVAVTGVAQPAHFLRELARLGLAVGAALTVADHAAIGRPALLAALGGQGRAVVTTAKDYWRDPAVFADLPVPVYVLGLRLDWDEAAVRQALAPWLPNS